MTYYWKIISSDTYHWHKECEHVPSNVESNPDWKVSEVKLSGREQCNQCKSLDR